MNLNDKDINGNTPLHLAVLEMRVCETEDSITLLLINAGADVNAVNEYRVTPFLLVCEECKTPNLPVIKEMEEHGMQITRSIASNALTFAVLQHANNVHAYTPIKSIAYLIQKGGEIDFQLTNNFWKWKPVQERMSLFIQHTNITSNFLKKAKKYRLLTKINQTELETVENPLKNTRFYELIEDKPGSFEKLYIILRVDKQGSAFEILIDCMKEAWDKLCSQIFVLPNPRLKQLMDSENSNLLVLLANNVELSVRKILETINEDIEVVDEHELERVSMKNSDKRIVIKSHTVTVWLVAKLLGLKRKLVCVGKELHDGIQDIEIVSDTHDWSHTSNVCMRKIWFKIDGLLHHVFELFHTPNIIGMLKFHDLKETYNFIQGINMYSNSIVFNILKCKLGHTKQHTYLSIEVFNHVMLDKLITQL